MHSSYCCSSYWRGYYYSIDHSAVEVASYPSVEALVFADDDARRFAGQDEGREELARRGLRGHTLHCVISLQRAQQRAACDDAMA